MARRLAVVGAVVAVLALAISVLAPAWSETGGRRVTLRLAEKSADDPPEDQGFVDVGKQGPSVGDYFVVGNDPVFNAARTRRVGAASGDCLAAQLGELRNGEPESGTFECDVSFALRGGLITTEGRFTFPGRPQNVFAVTGGTGAYKTARGTLTVVDTRQGLNFVFRLLL